MNFLPPRLSVGEDFLIIACIVLIQYQRVTDGRTDRQTSTVANTGLCITSYADAHRGVQVTQWRLAEFKLSYCSLLVFHWSRLETGRLLYCHRTMTMADVDWWFWPRCVMNTAIAWNIVYYYYQFIIIIGGTASLKAVPCYRSLSVCMHVCCLSNSCIVLKPLDIIRCHLAGTLVRSQVTW